MEEPTVRTTSGHLKAPALDGDVGYNLPAVQGVTIEPGGFAIVHTGIRVQMPPGFWGLIVARSSANRHGRLLVLPGVIDNGYRGELTAMCHNLSTEPATIGEGIAVAQLVLLPVVVFPVEQVLFLDDSERGDNGYGSTGSSV